MILDGRPKDEPALVAFIAHHGSRAASETTTGKPIPALEPIVVRALRSSRDNPALARMLPVFLWRVRRQLQPRPLAELAIRRGLGPALGYFVEVAASLGGTSTFEPLLARLRPLARSGKHPTYFFRTMRKNPFEAMAAQLHTPEGARRWGLLTGTPTDSFATYFRKVRDL